MNNLQELAKALKSRDERLMAVHNIFAHPAMEVCYWIGFLLPSVREMGSRFHRATIPKTGRTPTSFRKIPLPRSLRRVVNLKS